MTFCSSGVKQEDVFTCELTTDLAAIGTKLLDNLRIPFIELLLQRIPIIEFRRTAHKVTSPLCVFLYEEDRAVPLWNVLYLFPIVVTKSCPDFSRLQISEHFLPNSSAHPFQASYGKVSSHSPHPVDQWSIARLIFPLSFLSLLNIV